MGNAWRRGKIAGTPLHPADFRDDHLLDVFQVGAVLPRFAAAFKPVVQCSALGENHAAFPAHFGVPLARGAYRPCDAAGGRGRDRAHDRRL